MKYIKEILIFIYNTIEFTFLALGAAFMVSFPFLLAYCIYKMEIVIKINP